MSHVDARKSWRQRPVAIFPLVFLLSFALGLTNISLDTLLRLIHCDGFKERTPGMIFIPELDVCDLPMLQGLRSRDKTAFTAISTVLSILLSGLYGELLDKKGRTYIMLVSALFNLTGDALLLLMAISAFLRGSFTIYLASLIKGLGGSLIAANAAHYAFVVDASSSGRRSFALGLAWMVWWMGEGTAAILSRFLSSSYGNSSSATRILATAVAVWILYVLYTLFVLRETRLEIREELSEDSDARPLHRVGGALWQSLLLITKNPVLCWLCVVSSALCLVEGSLYLLLSYGNRVFKLDVLEAGVISTMMTMSRATSLIIFLPSLVAVYRCLFGDARRDTQIQDESREVEGPTERTPLLPVEPHEEVVLVDDRNHKGLSVTAQVVAQELAISRACLLLEAIGMLLIWYSRNWIELAASIWIGALGTAVVPSLWSLITLAVAPSQTGRVLTCVSALNATMMALRTPALGLVFRATLKHAAGLIWISSATVIAACAIIMFALRPHRFAI